MKLQRVCLAGALMVLVSCGDSGPSEPPLEEKPPPGPLLTTLELTLPARVEDPLGSVVPATVTARDGEGAVMELPSDTKLEVTAPDPYFEGSTVARAVGSPPDLGLELVWPGGVTVRAVSGAVRSSPLAVEVAPDEAVVGGLLERHVVVGGEATLTGYRMDLLDASALGADGTTLEVLGRDDATIRFRVPDVGASTEGCDPASSVALDLPDVSVYGPTPTLYYGRGDEVALEVGEYTMLGGAESRCLSFVAEGEYTLLYVDVRPIRESETMPEGTTQDWLHGLLEMEVADALAPPAEVAPRMPARELRASTGGVQGWRDEVDFRTAAPAGDPLPDNYLPFIDRPLVLGEQVSVDAEEFGTYEPARVLKLYGSSNEVVLLGLESEGATEGLAGGPFGLDPTLETLAEEALPVIARAFSEEFPDNYMTGQVIFLIRANRGGFPGVAMASGGGSIYDRPSGYVLLQGYESVDWRTGGPTDNLYAYAHEAAHLGQISRDHDLCLENPEEACGWGTAGTWSVEGGADFVTQEIQRRVRGFEFESNESALVVLGGVGGAGYEVFETPTHSFGQGYGYASWFMRDLHQRLVRRGMGVDEALSLVAKATYEPWYGWVSNKYWDPVDKKVKDGPPHQPVPGLTPRMREVMGGDWDPVEAILVGALTQAVDDRTPSPVLQDITLGDAWELYWGPFTSIRLGSGDSVAFLSRSWTWGWSHVEVPTGGGDLRYGSSAEGVEWIVARRR